MNICIIPSKICYKKKRKTKGNKTTKKKKQSDKNTKAYELKKIYKIQN